MDISTLGNHLITDVKDGEYPFYQQDEGVMINPTKIPQGVGSNLDSDTVDGIQAVTAAKSGPNKLVATDAGGKLPVDILPAGITSIAITNRAGTKTYKLYVEDDGALSYDPIP